MNKDFQIKFGARIKELRLASKLTQEQLAEKLNMERSNLAKIEGGKHFPTTENLEKITFILNIDPSELFNFSHCKNREILISEIISELNNLDDHKIQYLYKSVMNLKYLK